MPDHDERIARLEVHRETQEKLLAQHAEEIRLLTRWVTAAEERNRILSATHDENRDDRWQVWVRWLVNPGVPVGAILLLAWKLLIEGQ